MCFYLSTKFFNIPDQIKMNFFAWYLQLESKIHLRHIFFFQQNNKLKVKAILIFSLVFFSNNPDFSVLFISKLYESGNHICLLVSLYLKSCLVPGAYTAFKNIFPWIFLRGKNFKIWGSQKNKWKSMSKWSDQLCC